MTRALAVLRPEPGNAATAARIAALGLTAIRMPLFEVRPLAWTPPDPDLHDALILTSANTLRHAGPGLAELDRLPVFAVGRTTADAARNAGFRVVSVGNKDAAALLAHAQTRGIARALYLGGRDRMIAPGGIVATALSVYASAALLVAAKRVDELRDSIVLLHSVRAARAFADLVNARDQYRIAAISPAVLNAAGTGWAGAVAASEPTDDALLAAARKLAD
ncbi:uroporphyrinogen-III synthase [Sphingomonas aliaeris]|uniref:Uroporphyrinogen-III synthase n=1 Tax=Sphingomonas aliaeris TaxID=2759526 RepID=A0A974NUL2_9SPHN|nr:uroporphyrinogen-III synthase [Sphingomonas aliaeris]QQV77177.1 uroporphyrinogen-III synthase [Sphingomonas aliaeris]